MKKTLYDIFGVGSNASADSIRTAYKSLVQRHHPDKNRDDPHSEEILKAINYAYSILSDAKKRTAYDISLGIRHREEQAGRRPAPSRPTSAGPEKASATDPGQAAPQIRTSTKPAPQRDDTPQNGEKPSDRAPIPLPYATGISGPAKIRVVMAIMGAMLIGGFLVFLLPGRNENVEIAPLASNALPGTPAKENGEQNTPAVPAAPQPKMPSPGEQDIVASQMPAGGEVISPARDPSEKRAATQSTNETSPATIPSEKPITPPSAAGKSSEWIAPPAVAPKITATEPEPPATQQPQTAHTNDAESAPPPSRHAAVESANKSPALGDAATDYRTALQHEKGTGRAQDYSEAARLYQKAAGQGVADAQYRLGRLYTLGKGVPLDNVEAYAWLSLAAASHVEAAKPIVDYLGNIMTPQQIEEAKHKAKARQGAKKR